MLMRVTYVDYLPKREPDDYKPSDLTVRVVGRSAEGERVVRYIEGTTPRCWVPADEDIPEDVDADIQRIEKDIYEGIDIENGGKADAKCVHLGHPKQTSDFVENFSESWEADIPFYRRVTWDHNLSGYIRVPDDVTRCHVNDVDADIDPEDVDPIDPRVAIGDIEVVDDQSRGFDEMKEAADAPIMAATWYDSYTEEYEIIVVDHDQSVNPGEVKTEMRDHWGDHELADEYVEEADIGLVRVDSEEALLKKSIAFLQRTKPDITAGWNWVDFDWYYLLMRAAELDDVNVHDFSDIGRTEMRKVGTERRGTESAVEALPAFDQMDGLAKQTYGDWRSKSLEYVASEELGIGKIPDISVADAYEYNRSRMTAYNLLDVQLTVALTEKHGIEDFYLDLADFCGIQIQDTYSEKREVQGYIGTQRDDDELMPTNRVEELEDAAGGLVLTPGDGRYEDVAVFDLKSLYPSSMLTGNLSPETMVDDLDDADFVVPGMPETEDDAGGSIEPSDINWENDDPNLPWSMRPKGFHFGHQGVIPKYVGQLFPERRKYKTVRSDYEPGENEYVVYDNRQRGIKVVMNSFFGVENSKYFPLARDGVGDAITGLSRYVTWRAAEYIKDMGYSVIYGDTDSLLVSFGEDEYRSDTRKVKNAKGLASQLNSFMSTVSEDLGLPDDHPFVDCSELPHDLPDDANHAWAWEFEKLYGSFIQVGSKKRYAGTLVWKEGDFLDDKLDVTGFESERSDSMERTAEVQREVIKHVLRGAKFDTVSEYVRGEAERFREDADDLHEIGVPWNLSKPLEGPDSYGNLPRARAARYSNKHLGKDYSPGDDFRGFYVKSTPSFQEETDVIALDWTDTIPEGFDFDREKTIDKAFESALSPLLEEVGWTFTEVKDGMRNQSAADESVMEYDEDPFASDDSEDEQTDDDDTSFQGAGAW